MVDERSREDPVVDERSREDPVVDERSREDPVADERSREDPVPVGTPPRYQPRRRSRGSRSFWKSSRNRRWSLRGSWNTRWLRPHFTYWPTFSTASSGSDATIQRLATCSMGSSSAAFSISIGSLMLCFCSAVSDSGAQNRVFSSANFGSGS